MKQTRLGNNSELAITMNDRWDQHQGAEESQNPPGGIQLNHKEAQMGPTPSSDPWATPGRSVEGP